MKALTTFIAIALLAFSTTACSQQHTYRSGGFGSKTVKASKNYGTKDIKVDNFTKPVSYTHLVCRFVQNMLSGSLSLNFYEYFRIVMQRFVEQNKWMTCQCF